MNRVSPQQKLAGLAPFPIAPDKLARAHNLIPVLVIRTLFRVAQPYRFDARLVQRGKLVVLEPSVPVLVRPYPKTADVIADDFYTGGKTIPETIRELGVFAAQSFRSWRNAVNRLYEGTGLFPDAAPVVLPDAPAPKRGKAEKEQG